MFIWHALLFIFLLLMLLLQGAQVCKIPKLHRKNARL